MTRASRSTTSMPTPASWQELAHDEQADDHGGAKISATQGLRRVGWILANAPGTTSSRAMP